MHINPINQTNRPQFVSDKYGFIQTQPIVSMLADNGWQLVETKITKAKKAEREGFTKHKLTFEHPTLGNDGDSKPRLYLLNSHDRSSAFTFNLGFFRFICENGLMIGDAIGQQFKVYHTGKDLETNIYQRLVAALETIPKTLEIREQMRSLVLTAGQEQELVQRLNSKTAELRNLKPEGWTLHNIRRQEDSAHDLWTVFNACQESAINGGFYAERLNKNEQGVIRHKNKVRSIKAIDSDARINKALFDAAIEFMREIA